MRVLLGVVRGRAAIVCCLLRAVMLVGAVLGAFWFGPGQVLNRGCVLHSHDASFLGRLLCGVVDCEGWVCGGHRGGCRCLWRAPRGRCLLPRCFVCAVNYAEVRMRVAHAYAEKAYEMSLAISELQSLSRQTAGLLADIEKNCGHS